MCFFYLITVNVSECDANIFLRRVETQMQHFQNQSWAKLPPHNIDIGAEDGYTDIQPNGQTTLS